MLVTLNILAEDIMNNSYVNSEKCPITRALHRAGLKNYYDCGIDIEYSDGETIRTVQIVDNDVYQKNVGILHEMYNQKYEQLGIVTIWPKRPIEDFSFILDLNI